MTLDSALAPALGSTRDPREQRPEERPDGPIATLFEARVAGARVSLDASGAAFLPASQALIVSDLHFEKGSSFAARGVALPPFDTRATIERLADAIRRLKPRVVVALGDSFHDRALDARMDEDDRAVLASLVARVDAWVWIAGNHDPAPPRRFGGDVAEELELDGLTLRHEPEGAPTVGEVAGHFHPCARIVQRGRSIRRPCFVSDGDRLILPAFGAFCGGLNVCDPAFAELFVAPPLAFVLGRDRVHAIAADRLRPD